MSGTIVRDLKRQRRATGVVRGPQKRGPGQTPKIDRVKLQELVAERRVSCRATQVGLDPRRLVFVDEAWATTTMRSLTVNAQCVTVSTGRLAGSCLPFASHSVIMRS